MKLSDDHDTQSYVVSWLSNDIYPQSLSKERAASIVMHFPQTDSDIFRAAVHRHVYDTTESMGRPTGARPPTVADIQRQIRAELDERHRAIIDKRNREESDRHYARALKSGVWQAEIKASARIRHMITTRHKLDDRVPANRKVYLEAMEIIGKRYNGLRTATDEEIYEVAQGLVPQPDETQKYREE